MNDTSIDDSPPDSRNSIDKATLNNANDLLNSLEQSHRNDLSLHLYSSYLLKHILYKANEKKNFFEIDQFIRTQIKHNWTSWPSPRTVINPGTDLLYEDDILIGQVEPVKGLAEVQQEKRACIKHGEVSPRALVHSTNMLKLELNSFWQHCLAQSSSMSNEVLDIDKMSIPKNVQDNVTQKMDRLFDGLHIRVARMNKIEIHQNQASDAVTITQPQNQKVKVKKNPELTYHDIVIQGCEMGEDMVEIYMKSLELYNDLPLTLNRSQFRLPKSVLKKYRPAKKGKSGIQKLRKSKEKFIVVSKLLQDKRLSADDKVGLRKLSNKLIEGAIDKKVFFNVKGYQNNENVDDIYNIDDCLAKIPRN